MKNSPKGKRPEASLSTANAYCESWTCEVLIVNYYTDFKRSPRDPIFVAAIWRWDESQYEYSILESKEIISFDCKPEDWQWNDFTTKYLKEWIKIEKRNQQINKVLDK